MSKDYIVNLEQRRGQPGRYRLTDQEVEAEPLLPSPEAIAEIMAEAAQPVQPRNRTHNRQVFETLGDCATGCTVAPIASVGGENSAPPLDADLEGDGDQFDGLKDPSLKLQPKERSRA